MKLRQGDIEFLDGLLDGFDDLSDGAWQSACESAIEMCPRFNGRNAFDVWLAWCEAKAPLQP